MVITPHFGIRYMQDLTGDYSDCIVDSVDLLNSQLASHEMSFFFDSCDFRQQIIDGKHCWDMSGWAVPNELVHELEPAWIENDNVELENTTTSARAGKTSTASPTLPLTVAFPRRPTHDCPVPDIGCLLVASCQRQIHLVGLMEYSCLGGSALGSLWGWNRLVCFIGSATPLLSDEIICW